jgi:hypothetical protein
MSRNKINGSGRDLRSFVGSADLHDTVSVDLEGNLNLGKLMRCGGTPESSNLLIRLLSFV